MKKAILLTPVINALAVVSGLMLFAQPATPPQPAGAAEDRLA